jgi:cyclase
MMLGYLKQADQLGDFGTYFRHCFGRFDFASVTRRLPDRTFAGHLDLHVGKRLVQLIEVGPAHTTGDTIVHVPDAAILFSGDILFIEGHPLMWAGPVENWLKACRVMLDLQPKIVVPGHGPLTDARGIQAIIDYFEYVAEESRKHFDAGRSISEAAALMVARYRQWHDAERIAVNIAIMYSQFQGDASGPKMPALFGLMADFSKHLQTVSQ